MDGVEMRKWPSKLMQNVTFLKRFHSYHWTILMTFGWLEDSHPQDARLMNTISLSEKISRLNNILYNLTHNLWFGQHFHWHVVVILNKVEVIIFVIDTSFHPHQSSKKVLLKLSSCAWSISSEFSNSATLNPIYWFILLAN